MSYAVDERTKHFFLEGATEPVALEFSVNISNKIEDIIRILKENGLQVTEDVSDTDKIYIDEKGLITPPLRPQDVSSIFEILEKALDEAKCCIESIPHIIDLKSITACDYLPQDIKEEQTEIRRKYRNELKAGEVSFEDHMINEAKSSGKLIKITSYNRNKIPEEILRGFEAKHLLFSGSTISDPYRTATQLIRRNVRMASSNLRDAVRYSHTGGDSEKSMCTNQLITEGGQRYGFMHVYEEADDQCYYTGTGIEFSSKPCWKGVDTEETMVNRFKNPCVNEYIVFKERVLNEVIYYLFPIPKDDERWQDFKKLSVSPNTGISRYFAVRYNALYQEKDAPKARIPLVKEAFDENGIKDGFFSARINAVKSDLAEIRKKAEEIIKYIDILKQKSKEVQSANISFEEKKRELQKLEEESKKKKEESRRLAEQVKRYNPQGNLASLKKDIEDTTDACYKVEPLYLYSLIENLKKIEEDRLRMNEQKIYDMKRQIEADMEFLHSSDLNLLSKEDRKDLMKKIMRNQYRLSRDNLKNAIKIYSSSASLEERMDLFEDIFSLAAHNNKKVASAVRKNMKQSQELERYPEIKELLKRDNFFVKHTQKARKIAQKIFEKIQNSAQR